MFRFIFRLAVGLGAGVAVAAWAQMPDPATVKKVGPDAIRQELLNVSIWHVDWKGRQEGSSLIQFELREKELWARIDNGSRGVRESAVVLADDGFALKDSRGNDMVLKFTPAGQVSFQGAGGGYDYKFSPR